MARMRVTNHLWKAGHDKPTEFRPNLELTLSWGIRLLHDFENSLGPALEVLFLFCFAFIKSKQDPGPRNGTSLPPEPMVVSAHTASKKKIS